MPWPIFMQNTVNPPPSEPVLIVPLRGWPRAVGLFLYYLAILLALLVIYGRGDFATEKFIYQGF